MRNEKKLLAQEIVKYLQKSSYFFITDFNKLTVSEMSDIRKSLRPLGGEMHVIKNSLFKVALDDCKMPKVDGVFGGQIALISGGEEPSEIAKVLKKFHEGSKKEKFALKGGLLDDAVLSGNDVVALADLPSKDALRGQLLSIFNAPAQKFVRLMNAVPQSVLNVLQAKADKN